MAASRALTFGCAGKLFGNNGLANGSQGNKGKFHVLNSKRNANDSDETQECRTQVPNGQPDACKDKPDDVANKSQNTGSDVVLVGQILAVDCLFAKRKKRKLTYDKAGFGPRNADDGDGRQQSGKPPAKPHQATSKNEPQKIANKTHFNSGKNNLKFGYLASHQDKQAKFTIAQAEKPPKPKESAVAKVVDVLDFQPETSSEASVAQKQLSHHDI
jgi:hypothetical protein